MKIIFCVFAALHKNRVGEKLPIKNVSFLLLEIHSKTYIVMEG
jgi:hypothetical protein